MNDEPEQLGDLIRYWREATTEYRSLRRFADALGKSPSWLSKVERNCEMPGDETLIDIATLLKRDVNKLFEAAHRIHPEVKEPLAQRYSQVAGLLRTIGTMTPEQIVKLEKEAKAIKEDAM
jgi:transcriptional regulator with XRE-family HTH domain